MLKFSKCIFFVLICWNLGICNASLLGGVLNIVTGVLSLLSGLINIVTSLLFPGGVENINENGILCRLDTPGIATHYGYKNDPLEVTTDDGYIITVDCLFNSTARNDSLNPVIVWHGLMAASNSFVINYPNQSIAFLLADRGYYVCLPNSRGTEESQGYNSSILENPNSYWKFSWDEIAEFDTPAVVDAVLHRRNKTKVIYIGHSQGNTAMFALLSSKPEYNEKISIFAALAPVVYFSHTQSILYVLGNAGLPLLEPLLYGSGFSLQNNLTKLLFYGGCTLPTKALCDNLLFVLFGYSSHINENRLPAYMCHTPADFAWGQYLHYAQLKGVDAFEKYDFRSKNQEKYGQSTPPQFNISKVTAPVALYRSGNDLVAADVDVQKLISQLPHCISDQYIPASEKFTHLDYIFAKDVSELVYDHLINLIENY